MGSVGFSDCNHKLRVFMTIPNLKIAGAQKVLEQIVSNINYKDFEVLLVVQASRLGTSFEDTIDQSGAKVVYFNKKKGFHIRPFLQAWTELSDFKPDIIHTHMQSWFYLIPWVLFHQITVLHTIHSHPMHEEIGILRHIIKWLYRRSKFIPVAISSEIANKARTVYKLCEDNIETIYNPVDYKHFSEMKRINHGTFNFVAVGRLSPVKNHLFLMEVFADVLSELGNARLFLAGDGELSEQVRIKAKELGIQDFVEFLGVVGDVASLYAKSDVFVIPSLYEGLPMTLLEAEAAGLPVVASDVGGIPDIVKGNGFLVPVGDAEKFKKCMLELAGDPVLCAKMGKVSKTIACCYDVSAIVRYYEGTYNKYAKRS